MITQLQHSPFPECHVAFFTGDFGKASKESARHFRLYAGTVQFIAQLEPHLNHVYGVCHCATDSDTTSEIVDDL